MYKKLALLSAVLPMFYGCYYTDDYPVVQQENMVEGEYYQPVAMPAGMTVDSQPRLKIPSSIVVCRSKQCAPAKLSMSKEFIYNTLLHMFDSNARQKALVCAADSNTHACTEQYVSIPVTIGVTPGFIYIDDVKIADVSINDQNTMALNLMLNWGVTDNGQTPVCRPSKTVVFAKNVNNVLLEDNGYDCKMTTVGVSTIKTLFAIDYIDIDFGYIGGFYSIGVSGPAYGGGSGYMILRLPEEISLNPKDFGYAEQSMYQTGQKSGENTQFPNVDSVIKYNHPAAQYDKKRAMQAQSDSAAVTQYKGVQVFPITPKK
ncbi:MAG: hypothetical protein IJ099_02825 [Alphaproteobacteria bacterium]|nr:hypothetical protein [Alphaproteobacteria bacterium]